MQHGNSRYELMKAIVAMQDDNPQSMKILDKECVIRCLTP